MVDAKCEIPILGSFDKLSFQGREKGKTQTYKIEIVEKNKYLVQGSVTRFGEISPLWQNFRLFGIDLRVYLVGV